MAKKVVVGMSGGVDSSVAALLLKESGYDVVGLFMRNWDDGGEECCAERDYDDVRQVCDKIGIPYYTVNFAKEYLDRVFAHFLREYSAGRTPNPDVLCNREIKFDAFKEFCQKLGADYIATGHYCGLVRQTVKPPNKDIPSAFMASQQYAEKSGGEINCLVKASCLEKEQTYFLNQLSQSQLEGVLFPLAKIQKSEVREIAARHGLSVAQKKDSTGICFIGERRFKEFLKTYLPACAGDIRTNSGELVGRHDGLMFYTLGQRKGLNIGGKKGGTGERWFVLSKDLSTNTLIVSQGEHDLLFSDYLIAKQFNFIVPPTAREFECMAKFRYRQPDQAVRVTLNDDETVKIDFAKPQRAITSGQYAVLYSNDVMLGGGVIEQSFKK